MKSSEKAACFFANTLTLQVIGATAGFLNYRNGVGRRQTKTNRPKAPSRHRFEMLAPKWKT